MSLQEGNYARGASIHAIQDHEGFIRAHWPRQADVRRTAELLVADHLKIDVSQLTPVVRSQIETALAIANEQKYGSDWFTARMYSLARTTREAVK